MKYVVGIDEVGRGPLAGPVTVCVVACESKMYEKLKRDRRLPPLGKDSKKLSPTLRQKYAKIIQLCAKPSFAQLHRSSTSVKFFGTSRFSYVVTHISPKIIDSKGLSFSIRQAIEDGTKKLKLNNARITVLLDGGLKAPNHFKNQRTIIKGDEKEKIIAWASILAKVSRDKLMIRASRKFPKYGFEIHKGYGTLKHRKAIKTHGPSSFHRRSFLRNSLQN